MYELLMPGVSLFIFNNAYSFILKYVLKYLKVKIRFKDYSTENTIFKNSKAKG